MRVFENDSPIVNIRARGFDFDSDKPVQGITLDEEKEKAKTAVWHYVIHTVLAINVALFGFWFIGWWIHNYHWGFWFFARYGSELIRMVTTGQL